MIDGEAAVVTLADAGSDALIVTLIVGLALRLAGAFTWTVLPLPNSP